MRPSVGSLRIAYSLIFAALLLAGCGGDGGPGGRPDLRKIPTATPFANLPPPTIVSGEVLAGGSGDESTYVVEPGDSLSAIAVKLGVDLEELIRLNDLPDPSRLEVGQVLRVPVPPGASEGVFPPSEAPTGTEDIPGPTGEMQTYVVESGDNASDIADRFGITLQELAAANNTTIDDLRSLEVGDVLNIPPASREPVPEPAEEPIEEAPPEEPIEEPPPAEPTEEPPPEEPTEEPPPEPVETPTPEG